MFSIVFYEDKNGKSELYEELIELTQKSITSKDARIQLKQITYCLELLQRNGCKLPETISKHIKNDIYELRPGNNRILYFYFTNNEFVLLHMFRKKSKKTPMTEIEKAERKRDDFLVRNGGLE